MTTPPKRTKPRRAVRRSSNGVLPHGPEFDKQVKANVERLAVAEEAKRRLSAARAGPPFTFPRPDETLADDLRVPRPAINYRVKGLHPAGGNSLLVAQHKSGKTTLALTRTTTPKSAASPMRSMS